MSKENVSFAKTMKVADVPTLANDLEMRGKGHKALLVQMLMQQLDKQCGDDPAIINMILQGNFSYQSHGTPSSEL